MKPVYSFFLFSLLFAFLLGCKGKDEQIPAYIQIDSLVLNPSGTNPNAPHQLEMVQCYVDGNLIGSFHIPATIPVLYAGKHTVSLIPGFRLNGSSNQFVSYLMLNPMDSVLSLTPGKKTNFKNPVFTYKPTTTIAWDEDFEDNSSSLIPVSVPKGDTSLISTSDFSLNNRFRKNTNVYKVILNAADTLKYADIGSFTSFDNLPNDGRDIVLEFDIKSDIPVQLALRRTTPSKTEYVPYLYMYATKGEWKRFYVNLVYETAAQPAGSKYQILFSADKPASGSPSEILFDNIRITFL